MRALPRTAERGFTLIELMVSLVLFTVAVAGVLSVAVTMSSAFRDQRALVQTENSARTPMDYLADVLRNASPGVQSGAITDGYAGAASAICLAPNALVVTDGGTAGTDSLDVIYASGAYVTSARAAYDGSSTSLPVLDASGIAAGDYIVVTNLNTGIVVKVTAVTMATNTLTVALPTCLTGVPAGGGFANGSLVIRAMHAKFYIDPTGVDNIPNLMMQVDPNASTPPAAQPVADGVEDLQLAVGYDYNPIDNVIAPENTGGAGLDEWIFNVAGETMPTGGVIRSMRVTLIARAVNANTNGTTVLSFTRPIAEDHTTASAADIYRRRVLQSTVEIRNLGGSP